MATQERNEGGTSRSNPTRSTHPMGQQVGETARDLSERASQAAEGLQEGVENFRQKFNDVKDTVVDRTKEYARVTDTYVNENPWLAVGIGAGIGLLIGMMISPRGSNRPSS